MNISVPAQSKMLKHYVYFRNFIFSTRPTVLHCQVPYTRLQVLGLGYRNIGILFLFPLGHSSSIGFQLPIHTFEKKCGLEAKNPLQEIGWGTHSPKRQPGECMHTYYQLYTEHHHLSMVQEILMLYLVHSERQGNHSNSGTFWTLMLSDAISRTPCIFHQTLHKCTQNNPENFGVFLVQNTIHRWQHLQTTSSRVPDIINK